MNRFAALLGIAVTLLALGWVNLRWLETPLDLSPISSEKPAALAALEGSNSAPEGTLPELRTGTTEALLRPLFHADRRPFTLRPAELAVSPAVQETLPVEPLPNPKTSVTVLEKPELTLAGISLRGTYGRVLLGAAGGGEMHWYSKGEDVSGWIVASITRGAVTLSSGERSFTLELYPSTAAAGVEP